jgi:hypothetical protein
MNNMIRLFISMLVVFSMQINALTTQGNQIVNSEGTPVEFKGINWFGFNNGQTMVDGLWAGPDSLSLDFATVVYRMQLLGFNAVRLPFSFSDLYNLSPKNYTQNSPTASQSEIQTSVTDPSVTVPSGDIIPPQVYSPPNNVPGIANSYLPNDTTLNRFLWVVNFFARNGFYVLIDDHTEDQTVLNGTSQWVQYWVNLVTAISQDPISQKMLMIDILNEPDSKGIRWAASGNLPALSDLYLAAMDALYPINSNLLFFVEGAGQGGIQANWGDGFCTNSQVIAQYGLSDPNPFFQALLTRSYLNQVVISPHVYPPTVTGASTDYYGTGLWNRLSTSFGYLTQQGYCTGSTPCKVFPVAVGEFGSRFTDSRDLQSMPDIASYLNNSGAAADGKHQAISSWFYWDWNANSGDTGGIVADDWRTILWNKVEYLTSIGLNPWYAGPIQPVQTGSLCVSISPVSGLTAQALQTITAGNYSFNVTAFNEPVCQTVPVGEYTVTAPTLTVANTQYTANSQNISVVAGQTSTAEIVYQPSATPVTGPCNVSIQLGTAWQEGNTYQNVLNLFITNTGSAAINVPWTLTLTNSSYLAVTSSWNLTSPTIQNGTITTQATSSWEDLASNGSPINVGLIISSSTPNFLPTSVTINGVACTVTTK